jgi:hypothetical protein
MGTRLLPVRSGLLRRVSHQCPLAWLETTVPTSTKIGRC